MADPVVYIVDDDATIRDALAMLLKTVGFSVRPFASGEELLDELRPDWNGCLLLDISMPGMNGIEVQEQLQNKQSTLPIIFVTGMDDVPTAVKAMHSGAFDFIQKPYQEDELLDRIKAAFEADRASKETTAAKQEIQSRATTLTPREREVMGHIVAGSANKVIAIDLGLSQRTIEVHRSRIMEKMQARSLAELVRMSIAVASN
jgi:FixJ family two-component response regulator